MSSVNLGVDGLASGLDTTTLINSLMTAEAAPQNLLKTRLTQTQSLVSALQSLNSKVASLATAATSAAKASSWSTYAATSTDSAIATATATSSASASSLTFTVDKLAQSQVSVADLPSSFPTEPPAITIVRGGTMTTIEPTTGSLADVTAAINAAADAGIKAVAVRISSGATPQYRIQLTGTGTGTDNSFQVYLGTQADVTAGTAQQWSMTTVQPAQDAQITLWAGSAAEKTFTSASNTFSDALTGVDLTVKAVSSTPVTVSVAQDSAAVQKLGSALVDNLNVVFSEIASRTGTTTTTDTDGRTVVSGGLFSGDSTVRTLQERLLAAGSNPVNGVSPSEVGIVVGRDGTFTFDADKFSAALAADPARVQSIVSTVAQRVADVAEPASDSIDGTLTRTIASQQSTAKDLNDQIADWDRRLEMRRDTLQTQFNNLEVTMSNLKSQSSWLSSQIAALPSWSSSSSSN